MHELLYTFWSNIYTYYEYHLSSVYHIWLMTDYSISAYWYHTFLPTFLPIWRLQTPNAQGHRGCRVQVWGHRDLLWEGGVELYKLTRKKSSAKPCCYPIWSVWLRSDEQWQWKLWFRRFFKEFFSTQPTYQLVFHTRSKWSQSKWYSFTKAAFQPVC